MPKDLTQKSYSTYFKVGLVIVGFLAFLFYSNFQAQKREWLEAISTNEYLSNEIWCANNKIRRDGAGGFESYDGWPCIKVSSITPLAKGPKDASNGDSTICSTVTLAREVGLPGEETYQDYKTKSYCPIYNANESGSISDEIYDKDINKDLDILTSQACQTYSFRLTEEGALILCSGRI